MPSLWHLDGHLSSSSFII
jgi:hypothetical protein